MKRVIFACIEKTLHFQLKEDMVHVSAAREVKEEVERYKQQLEQNKHKTAYRIIEENMQADDSIIMKVKLQYNKVPCGDYLN